MAPFGKIILPPLADIKEKGGEGKGSFKEKGEREKAPIKRKERGKGSDKDKGEMEKAPIKGKGRGKGSCKKKGERKRLR